MGSTKGVELLRASNPPLLEWLGSPIVYRETTRAAQQMRDLAARHHSPLACAYHYLHMARRNFRDYLQGDEVWRKKYLYVLRPLLAVRWVELGLGLVPMRFDALVDRVVEDAPLRAAISELVREKRKGLELARGPRIEAISSFIEREISRLEGTEMAQKPTRPPVAPFDSLFRGTLEETWIRR